MPDDNIIPFQPRPSLAPQEPAPKRPPPMFNIPPVTKFLTGAILIVHLVMTLLSFSILPDAFQFSVLYAGFIPAAWTGGLPFHWWTPLSLLGFSFLHDGWMHLAFNTVMLVAMGSGLERSVGQKPYLLIYIVSTLLAAITHFALYPTSLMPIVGASGGISGLFGAMILMINQQQRDISGIRKNTLKPVIIAYIGISVAVGLMGAPNGAPVAWVAHIGGFIAGMGLMALILKRQNPQC